MKMESEIGGNLKEKMEEEQNKRELAKVKNTKERGRKGEEG